MEKATSHDSPTVGAGGVVNEVQQAYNDFQQLVAQYIVYTRLGNVRRSQVQDLKGTLPDCKVFFENE